MSAPPAGRTWRAADKCRVLIRLRTSTMPRRMPARAPKPSSVAIRTFPLTPKAGSDEPSFVLRF